MHSFRVTAVLTAAFLAGAAGAEAVVRVRGTAPAERGGVAGAAAPAPVGDLVALEVRDEEGTVAQGRLVSPAGRTSRLVLHDPADPASIRMVLRVSTAREASGDIAVDYALELPGLGASTSGRISVVPGIESAFDIAPDLRGVVTALPVPSKAFDRWIASERLRRAPHST
jgi:hypothetical protein